MTTPPDPMQVPVDARRVIGILQGRLQTEIGRSATLEAQLQEANERERGLREMIARLQPADALPAPELDLSRLGDGG